MPIHPISFSIPESKTIDSVPEKTKTFAHIIPGDMSTYIFTQEDAYYRDYQSAVFGKTCKKGGWDCMRHYEILANGCIPWFSDLDKCPAQTMTHLPKQLILDAMASKTPEQYIPALLDYTKTHLTCRAMAQYLLTTVGCSSPKRVLLLGLDPRPDYLRDLTLIGLKQILGDQCVESVHVPFIYEDYPTPERNYGRGFSYSRILPVSSKPPMVHIDEIRSHAFDLILYGSVHRGLPYWDEVQKSYRPHEIVMLCGEDEHDLSTCPARLHGETGYNGFIREL